MSEFSEIVCFETHDEQGCELCFMFCISSAVADLRMPDGTPLIEARICEDCALRIFVKLRDTRERSERNEQVKKCVAELREDEPMVSTGRMSQVLQTFSNPFEGLAEPGPPPDGAFLTTDRLLLAQMHAMLQELHTELVARKTGVNSKQEGKRD